LWIVSKILRYLGIALAIIILAVIALILWIDPPPFRLQEADEFVLSIPTFSPPGPHDPIETGLACTLKLDGGVSKYGGRPTLTIFDWIKKQYGKPPEKDIHLYGTKLNDAWAIKVDRATKSFCFQKAQA
jgi:hypothetical protein